MKDTRRRRMVFLLAIIVLIASVAYAGFYSKTLRRMRAQEPVQKNQGPSTYKAEEVTVPPIVHSKVKSLEIAGVRLKDQGKPYAAIEIDVLNKSAKGCTSVSLVSGDDNDSGGITIDGGLFNDTPASVIEPYSTKTLNMFLNAIVEGPPVTLNAAMFSDGKEEGDAKALQSMHFARDHAKAQREAKKKAGQP